jgi:hypothetical protein
MANQAIDHGAIATKDSGKVAPSLRVALELAHQVSITQVLEGLHQMMIGFWKVGDSHCAGHGQSHTSSNNETNNAHPMGTTRLSKSASNIATSPPLHTLLRPNQTKVLDFQGTIP